MIPLPTFAIAARCVHCVSFEVTATSPSHFRPLLQIGMRCPSNAYNKAVCTGGVCSTCEAFYCAHSHRQSSDPVPFQHVSPARVEQTTRACASIPTPTSGTVAPSEKSARLPSELQVAPLARAPSVCTPPSLLPVHLSCTDLLTFISL